MQRELFRKTGSEDSFLEKHWNTHQIGFGYYIKIVDLTDDELQTAIQYIGPHHNDFPAYPELYKEAYRRKLIVETLPELQPKDTKELLRKEITKRHREEFWKIVDKQFILYDATHEEDSDEDE